MKIPLDNSGSYLEPDDGPRDSKYHKHFVKIQPILGTRTGHTITLSCGHVVQTFGNLHHADGVALCTQCRDMDDLRSTE